MTNAATTHLDVRKDVLRFLQRHPTAVLATVSPKGEPQGATISYVCDDDFNFYFATRKHSRKARNLASNPRVGIVVGTDPDAPGTVQAQGTAQRIGKEHFFVMHFPRIVNLAAPEWFVFLSLPGIDYVFFQVTPTWLQWLNLDKQGYPKTYQRDFHGVIPRVSTLLS